MIHLIIYASQVLWLILEVNTVLEAKETFLSEYKYFGGFSLFEGGRHLLPNFSQPFFHKIIMFLCQKILSFRDRGQVLKKYSQ